MYEASLVLLVNKGESRLTESGYGATTYLESRWWGFLSQLDLCYTGSILSTRSLTRFLVAQAESNGTQCADTCVMAMLSLIPLVGVLGLMWLVWTLESLSVRHGADDVRGAKGMTG